MSQEEVLDSRLLQFQVSHHGTAVLISLSGELDISTAQQFRKCMVELLQETADQVITINLAKVTFIDSTGLSILITAHKRLQGAGGHLLIEDPPSAVLRLFDVSGLRSHLTVSSEAQRHSANQMPH